MNKRRRERKQRKHEGKEIPSRHHRKPQAQGGSDDPSNISIVSRKYHMAWSTLFNGHMTVQEIADTINEVWLDPEYELIVRSKE